ncbi:hypothetical protein D9M68_651740 [compost metagenome]
MFGKTHVGDAPAVIAPTGVERHLQPLPQRAVRTGGVDHVLGLDAVAARGGLHGERGAGVVLLEGHQAVLPAQLHMAEGADALDQIAFDVELLDVQEGWLAREVEIALLLQIEAEDFVLARKGSPHTPLHAFGNHPLVDAQALKDLKRFLRVADAARRGAFDTHGVVFVDQHRSHAIARQRAGQRQSGDAAADDHHRVPHERAALQFRGGFERVFGQVVACATAEFVSVGGSGFPVCARAAIHEWVLFGSVHGPSCPGGRCSGPRK